MNDGNDKITKYFNGTLSVRVRKGKKQDISDTVIPTQIENMMSITH